MKVLYAKSGPDWTPLNLHLQQVAVSARAFARNLQLDVDVAYHGGILHDIGKAHPVFQERLKGVRGNGKTFRHEIASLFFLSLFPESQWGFLIEMVVGHHKSIINDIGGKGLLDLEENDDYEEFHIGEWETWSNDAMRLLKELGVSCKQISREEALGNLDYSIEYCERKYRERGYSVWRGLLMGADHFASSLVEKAEEQLDRVFKTPNLSFYNRQHELFPLSLKDASQDKKHTIVVACTGAGKTDYLFRRCRGRVFYTLPFQASINSMFKRVGNDLERDNPDIDIRVLHSTSIIVKRKENEETSLQNLMGSAVKILTPHQLASIALGMKGYEAMILDIKGCDVVLDEVHTYSGISQALVLKLIQVLKALDCRIHIGTATMPTILYEKIKEILGEDILEVKLNNNELSLFNRHFTYKIESFDDAKDVINKAVEQNQKVLIVVNRIKDAQELYQEIKNRYSDVPVLLLHSRYRRKDRNIKEQQLIGLDINGKPTYEYNTSNKACVVVSTQIVEVSLDISFDMMITATAPLDAMIQRFGRVNRKRNKSTIGRYKNIYVIAPPNDEKEARPYELEILRKSFQALPHGEILEEKDLQDKIDSVYTQLDFLPIEEHSVYRNEGFMLGKLTHRSKAILFELLSIDSVSCIVESDEESYLNGDFENRMNLEISVPYWSVAKMRQLDKGNKPFVVPDKSYSYEMGLDISEVKQENFNVLNQFL